MDNKEPTFSIVFTVEQLQILDEGLKLVPYGRVVQLIDSINLQLRVLQSQSHKTS